MSAPTLWTDERDAVLRQLWAEGHSTAEIGRRMGGMTKNAIIGRAGRIGLPRRDNPMIVRAPTVSNPRHNKPRPTRERAHLPRTIIEAHKPALVETPQPGGLPPLSPRVAPSVPAAASGQPIQPAPSLWKRCQWPTGDKHDAGIRFECTDAPMPGRPYCGPHCAIAYVPYVARARAA